MIRDHLENLAKKEDEDVIREIEGEDIIGNLPKRRKLITDYIKRVVKKVFLLYKIVQARENNWKTGTKKVWYSNVSGIPMS